MADTTQPAPGELEVIRSFVNTNDIDDGIEKLATPKLLGEWLVEHGLDPGTRRLTEADRQRALELREALRALLLANGGEPLGERPIQALNRASKAAQLGVRFNASGEAELAPAGRGIERALASLLAIVLRGMADGTWFRLKACRADTCQWAFYDQSKNRSAQWCSMAVCGNREKARSYRRRHRAEQGRAVKRPA
jgi:predicted RNA-binding Zn ribbon-like protein